MGIINSFFRIARMMSIDISLGGVILSIGISKFIGVQVPAVANICLGLAIWLIYTLDHLIDAHKGEDHLVIQRHLFHRRHSLKLATLAVIVSILGIFLSFALPLSTLVLGIGLGILILIYFSLILFIPKFYFKEPFIATVYCAGIFLAPLSLHQAPLSVSVLLLVGQVFLLAFINLILFSSIEKNDDRIDGHTSLAIKIGDSNTRVLLKILFMVLLIVQGFNLFYLGWTFRQPFQWLLIMMSLVLFFINSNREYFSQSERYRTFGDGIFFIPVVWLL